jgi:hypothetical protein
MQIKAALEAQIAEKHKVKEEEKKRWQREEVKAENKFQNQSQPDRSEKKEKPDVAQPQITENSTINILATQQIPEPPTIACIAAIGVEEPRILSNTLPATKPFSIPVQVDSPNYKTNSIAL